MKTYQYRKNLPKLVTLITMGLASVPTESFRNKYLPLISYSQQNLATNVSNNFVTIPINEATNQINRLAHLLTDDLHQLKKKWEKYHYLFITENTYKQINKKLKNIDTYLVDIKMALTIISFSSPQKRENTILFGRSLAVYRKVLNEIISFIEQTKPPLKTTNKLINVKEEEVRKLIQAEHKKLGLSTTHFNKNIV